MERHQDRVVFVSICLIYSILVWMVSDLQLFWDTVQFGGKHPNFFYRHPFDFILPNELDSGHIPAFGYYISIIWQVFERSLSTTHWAMLPFLVGMAYQIYIFCKGLFAFQKWQILVPLLLLLDPTLMSQSILVSPDIGLVFFFFLLLNSFQKNQKLYIVLAAIGLVLISNRGVLVLGSVGLWVLIQNYRSGIKNILGVLILFLPSALIFLGYHTYHFSKLGWVFYHDLSPWAPSFAKAEGWDIAKNGLLFLHRLLDFGRIGLLIIVMLLIKKINWKKIFQDKNTQLLIILALLLGYPFINQVGLNGHRYLLPVILITELILLKALMTHGKKLYYCYVAILFFLLTGHLWRYPSSIAQGWDSSLAHIGFYRNQQEFYSFVTNNNIPANEISSVFPLVASHRDQFISDIDIQLSSNENEETSYVLLSDMAPKFKVNNSDKYYLIKHFHNYELNFYLYKRK